VLPPHDQNVLPVLHISICCKACQMEYTTVLRPFFQDHPVEPVPEDNFSTLWFKGRLTEADTLTMQMGATPPSPTLSSAHLHHPPFLQTGCPSWCPTNSVKALKANWSTPLNSSAGYCEAATERPVVKKWSTLKWATGERLDNWISDSSSCSRILLR